MDFFFGFLVYFVVWWITLFAVLPLWVKPQIDEGDMVPGTATSAPVSAMMLKKVVVTSLVSAGLFLLFYLLIQNEVLTLDSFPFLPRFDGTYE